MTNSDVIIRPATAEDATAWYNGPPKCSFKGYVAEIDGALVGIGGIYFQNGVAFAFSEMRDGLRPHRKAIVKAVKILVDLIDSAGGAVYAVACPTEPTAPYLLAKLGFKPTGLVGPLGETLVRS